MILKACSRCEIEKPLTSEFFHRSSKDRTGFKSDCKVCRSEINKKYQPTSDYYLKNKEKFKERQIKNKEKIKKYTQKYYEQNKDKINQQALTYYHKNKAKIKQKYDPIKDNIKKQKRRTLKKQELATFTIQQWMDCKEYFKNNCAYCGKNEKLSQDHFVPLSKGGEYTSRNIIPACQSCNCSKGNRAFFEWFPEQIFYNESKEKLILKYLGIKNSEQQIVLF